MDYVSWQGQLGEDADVLELLSLAGWRYYTGARLKAARAFPGD